MLLPFPCNSIGILSKFNLCCDKKDIPFSDNNSIKLNDYPHLTFISDNFSYLYSINSTSS